MALNGALLALAMGAFAIGTSEFVIMGLLPDVASDLAVSIPQAGLLVTGYALGVVIGAPILAVLTAGLPRRPTLIALASLFTAGNLLCALAPSYDLLMAARVLTALSHGTFFGIGSVVAAALVKPQRRSQAIALMFTGLTLANVLGVPAGRLIGHQFGWRTTFAAVVVISLIAVAALALLLPRRIATSKASIVKEFGALRDPRVLLALLTSVLCSASLFCVFTYITPTLTEVNGFSAAASCKRRVDKSTRGTITLATQSLMAPASSVLIVSRVISSARLEEVHLNLAYRWFCRLGLDGLNRLEPGQRVDGVGRRRSREPLRVLSSRPDGEAAAIT